MSFRRELLQPRWVVAHLMVLTVIITFPMLGRWQLHRWDQEKAIQARIDARIDGDSIAVPDVLNLDTSSSAIDDLEFQPVTVTGTYLADQEVAHRNRDLEGQGGFDWLTPLRLADGTAILVRRGFVPPTRLSGSDPSPAPPPEGTVTVTGWLEKSVGQPGFGPQDPATGVLDKMFHADIPRIDQQVSADLLPMLLHLRTQTPAQPGELPVAQPVTPRDTTQNISYAVQWFVFTAIAIIGYAIVLRRKRQEASEQDVDEDADVKVG